MVSTAARHTHVATGGLFMAHTHTHWYTRNRTSRRNTHPIPNGRHVPNKRRDAIALGWPVIVWRRLLVPTVGVGLMVSRRPMPCVLPCPVGHTMSVSASCRIQPSVSAALPLQTDGLWSPSMSARVVGTLGSRRYVPHTLVHGDLFVGSSVERQSGCCMCLCVCSRICTQHDLAFISMFCHKARLGGKETCKSSGP